MKTNFFESLSPIRASPEQHAHTYDSKKLSSSQGLNFVSFSYLEKKVFKQGCRLIAGIDEAGRGPLAGPVSAGVVVVKPGLKIHAPVRDSKSLTARQREKVFDEIQNNPKIDWRVSFVWPSVIDRVNIWQATLLAWRRCLKKLDRQPDFLFVDGANEIPGLKTAQQAVIQGDQKIKVISLASIMAKVSRDRLMMRLAEKYPQYEFDQHKGYGTKLHFEKLRKFGPSEIHRRSFQPVFGNLSFPDKVYYIVSRIPRGQTVTYQQVAQRIGHPRAFRAVGNVLNKNTSSQVPCHRVIRSNGQIGGFARGPQAKAKLLKKEKAI